MRAAALAGCSQIEHGVFATPEVLKLLAERKVYFDPQVCLVFRNYLDNRAKYQGIGNYNDSGFASMERALPLAAKMYKQAIATPGLDVVYGTDAVAGAHGRNVEELVCRVQGWRTEANGRHRLGDVAQRAGARHGRLVRYRRAGQAR